MAFINFQNKFNPPPPPGAPFADYNAQGLTIGALTSWANDGSDGYGTLDTFPGELTSPTVVAGTDGYGPIDGAQYVSFVKASDDAIQGDFSYTRSGGIKFAACVRWVGTDGTEQTFFDGDSAANRVIVKRAVTNTAWVGGSAATVSAIGSSLAAERDKWVRVYGTLGVKGNKNYLLVERVVRGLGDTGAASLSGLTIGSDYLGFNKGNIDVARLTLWDDDTSIQDIERWLEESYYFSPVPPANPFNWYNPNNFVKGSFVPTITDAGSDGADLTNSTVTINYDTDCPDQKVFVFDGSTGSLYADSSYSIISDTFTVCTSVRLNTANKKNYIASTISSAFTYWACYINASNITARSAGTEKTGGDLDTIEPFTTPNRWTNLSFVFRLGAGGGETVVDGYSYASGDEGDSNPNRLSIGYYYDGYTEYFFDGHMSDILIYEGTNDTSGVHLYVDQWLRNWRRLCTTPGSPVFDYDAESLGHNSDDLVSTWIDDGTGAKDLAQTGGLRPVFDNFGGPEQDAKNTVYFNGATYMDSGTFTAKTQVGASAVVFKPASVSVGDTALIGSGTAGTEWSIKLTGSPEYNYSKIDSGSALTAGFGKGLGVNDWAWTAAEYNGASSHIENSNGAKVPGSAGTETFGTIARVGSDAGTNSVDAYISRAIVWDDGTTIESVGEWLRRRYPGASQRGLQLGLAAGMAGTTAPPGAPFADYDAQLEDVGTLTEWINRGSDSDGILDTTPGTSNNPTVIMDGTGPITGAKFVRFSLSNTEGLQGPFTTARTGEVVFAAIVRWRGAATADDQLCFDGGTDSTHRMTLYRRVGSAGGAWAIYGGTVVPSGTYAETEKWVRVVGKFSSTDALLSVERAKRGTGASTGTQDLDGFTIGTIYSGDAAWANVDVARVTLWEDGTTPLQAERWLEEAYPFDPVPPGNPIHWWDPNDYKVGTLSGAGAVVDKGSGGVDLTATALDVVLDDSDRGCPEQKVFKFNGTTSQADDSGGFSLTSDIHLFAACIRPTVDSTLSTVFGDRTGSTWYCRVTNTNVLQRYFGSTAGNAQDYDTFAPFNTRVRWSNVQWLTAASGGNGATYLDGYADGVATEGDNNPGSLGIGHYASGTGRFQGNLSDLLIYTGANEANASRAAEVEMWLQRHRRLSTQPGTTFSDIDAESITLASGEPVSTWVNDSTINDFTQTGTNRPTLLVGAGPEPASSVKHPAAVKEVYFDNASSQYMKTSGSFTAKAQPGAIAILYKAAVWPVAGGDQLTSSGDAAGTSWDVYLYDAAGTQQTRVNFGSTATLTPSNDVIDEWHWVAVEVSNTTSRIVNSKGQDSGDVTGGAETIGTSLSIAASYVPNGYIDASFARMVHWADGTTWEKVSEWLARRYPGVNPYG